MAKCECGREMLKANGCRFKRIVVHGKSTKPITASRLATPVTGTKSMSGLRKKRISAVAIAEQKSASIITRIAITRDVRFAEVSF